MREIKFRGYNEFDKRWVYGYGLHQSIFIDGSSNAYVTAGIREVFIVDKESAGQYTGLKDKNGVEIYEGDIIETHEHRIQTIIWEDNGFKRKYTFERTYQGESYFETRIIDMGDSSNRNWGYKVIGNVYENKNLLEVK